MGQEPVTDDREPAVPVIAPVPIESLRSLLDEAARDWPELSAPGARMWLHVDARGAGVAAQMAVADWSGTVIARRQFDGQWEASGAITWTPGRLQGR